MRRFVWTLVFIGTALSSGGCNKAAPSRSGGGESHEKRVEVHHPQPESELTTVTLSESARSHLDIQTAAARREDVTSHRTYGGVVVIPEGRSIMISAPLAGTIDTAEVSTFPQPGESVSIGAPLFRLIPSLQGRGEVLNPADRIALVRARADLESARAQALGDVEAANARLSGTEIALGRAEKLVQQNAGSVRSLDEATANHLVAKAALDAAQVRRDVIEATLNSLSGSSENASLQIAMPFSGVVQRLFVAPNEVIAIGSPLCEIAATDPLWVRVSVYVGDTQAIALSNSAQARRFGSPLSTEISLAPVNAPPTANPAIATVDLYYALDNSKGEFQAGERLIVSVPTKDDTNALVIPRMAVLYDIHGDSWAYVAEREGVYVRKRITISRIIDNRVEVAGGIDDGDLVVTSGAAELFGVEFGSSGH